MTIEPIWLGAMLGLIVLLGLAIHVAGEWRELGRIRELQAQLSALKEQRPNLRLELHTLWVKQRARCYYVFRPQRPAAGPRPLLLAFHGGGEGNGLRFARQTQLNVIGEREGAVVVYPNARAYWNDGRRTTAREGDDIAFVRTLIEQLQRDHDIDLSRIYATGASNGGMLVLRLACELSDQIAAFAPVLASIPVDYIKVCQPSRALPIMMINGTADQLIPWNGGEILASRNLGKGGQVMAVESMVEFWRQHNGCWSACRIEELPVPDNGEAPMRVDLLDYPGCADGAAVCLVRIQGGGHVWPGSRRPPQVRRADLIGRASPLNASDLIWTFCAAYQLPEADSSSDSGSER